MTIRIVVADDHQILRHGLKTSLDKEPDFQVVAEAKDGRSAVELTEKHHPDIVLMDVSMPDLNGIEATRRIKAVQPKVKVVALSMYFDKRYVLGMLKSGAAGYLLKTCAFEELSQALRDVQHGAIYLSSEITAVVVEGVIQSPEEEQEQPTISLTPREREVLQLVAEGRTTREISSFLSVSEKTVETHRRQIMNKLNLRSVAALTKYAVREGLTSLDA
jgi:DNA-binding NarL/FixJ family response regulator